MATETLSQNLLVWMQLPPTQNLACEQVLRSRMGRKESGKRKVGVGEVSARFARRYLARRLSKFYCAGSATDS